MITGLEQTHAINEAINSVNFPKYVNPRLEALEFFRDYVDCQDLTVGHDYFDALSGKYLGKYFGETEVNGTNEKRHVFTVDSGSMSQLKEEELVNVLPFSRTLEFSFKVGHIRTKRTQELADFDASVFKVATELSVNTGRLFAQVLVDKIKGLFAITDAKKGKISEDKVEQIRSAHDILYGRLVNEYLGEFPGLKHTELTNGQYYLVFRDGKLVSSVFKFVSLSFLSGSPLEGIVNDQKIQIEFINSDIFYTPDELSIARDKATNVANKSFEILVAGLRLSFAKKLKGE